MSYASWFGAFLALPCECEQLIQPLISLYHSSSIRWLENIVLTTLNAHFPSNIIQITYQGLGLYEH